MAKDDHEGSGAPGGRGDARGGSVVGRLLRRRVPVWLLLAAVAAVAAALAAALVLERQSSVELGPAVGTAERVVVQMTLCNGDVDRLDLNPRRAELDLEDVLREEGAAAADVRVERRDCPRPSER